MQSVCRKEHGKEGHEYRPRIKLAVLPDHRAVFILIAPVYLKSLTQPEFKHNVCGFDQENILISKLLFVDTTTFALEFLKVNFITHTHTSKKYIFFI